MIIIKKSHYLMILVISVVIVSVFGVNFYNYLKDSGKIGDLNIKYFSENFIFITVVSVLVLFFVYIFILLRSINLFKELDRLNELSKYGSYGLDGQLKKLGKLGEKLNTLLSAIKEQNIMKSLRINSLSDINEFLLKNIDIELVLVGSNGNITGASSQLLNKFKATGDVLQDKNVSTIFEELDFNSIAQELEQQRIPVVKESLVLEISGNKIKDDFIFYPFFNIKNYLSDIAIIINRGNVLEQITGKISQIKKEGERLQKKFFTSIKEKFQQLLKKGGDQGSK